MRAAVYNQHLTTMGGGERYTGMLATGLARDVPGVTHVDLVGHGAVTLRGLEEHLGIEMPGVDLRVVPDRGETWLSDLTREYDVFVNASYMSRVVSQARHSSYAVYFPTPWDHDLTPAQKRIGRALAPLVSGHRPPYVFGPGWFPPEGGRRRSWSWTSGDAELDLPPGPGSPLVLAVGRPGAAGATELVVEVDGRLASRTAVRPGRFTRVAVAVPPSDRPRRVRLLSDVFAPPAPDQRTLGVAVSDLRLGRRGVRDGLLRRLPYLARDSANLAFLDSYDQVLSISDYTADWVQRLWHRRSEVLYPPVHTQAVSPGEKGKLLLSIGRFFSDDRGHSKKQREMVRAFVHAQDRGLLGGWEYHLVGGCSEEDRPYLDEVRRDAAGHQVHLHPNAPRGLVEELLARSSVFWHATGVNEDPEDRPWSLEHFGITTVEAMAAGCVPVVIAQAGQREIIEDGVNGVLFENLDDLVRRTAELVADPQRREVMSAAAQERAQAFSEHAFAERWAALAHDLVGGP